MTTPTLSESAKILRAAKQARNRTTLGELENLMREASHWQRRLTIAGNKLTKVQGKIERLALAMARERFDAELGGAQ